MKLAEFRGAACISREREGIVITRGIAALALLARIEPVTSQS
jgi:hypothetical protein